MNCENHGGFAPFSCVMYGSSFSHPRFFISFHRFIPSFLRTERVLSYGCFAYGANRSHKSRTWHYAPRLYFHRKDVSRRQRRGRHGAILLHIKSSVIVPSIPRAGVSQFPVLFSWNGVQFLSRWQRRKGVRASFPGLLSRNQSGENARSHLLPLLSSLSPLLGFCPNLAEEKECGGRRMGLK